MAVLDGGFPKWQAEGREIEDMPPIIRDRHMTVSRQNQLVKDVTQVAHAAKLGEAEILDARSAARFRGEAPEPRAGLRSGHIPGSKNIPFAEVLNPDGTMLVQTYVADLLDDTTVPLATVEKITRGRDADGRMLGDDQADALSLIHI